MDWFERIAGFAEGDATEVRSRLKVDVESIVYAVTGTRCGMGRLEIVSFAEPPERMGRLGALAQASDPQPIRTVRAMSAGSTCHPIVRMQTSCCVRPAPFILETTARH